jgi:hypothetical protein
MLTQLAKAGEDVPALASRPILTPWQQTYMDAFHTLSSSRNYTSVGIAAIPYHQILLWMNEHKITDLSDREEFVIVLQSIDNTFLEHAHKK